MTEHIKHLQSKAEESKAFETRLVKVESKLKMTRELVQVVLDQVDAISSERNLLGEDPRKL